MAKLKKSLTGQTMIDSTPKKTRQGMGKHTNDHTQSFYIITPSGFGIEYGANSRLVDKDWAVKTYDAPAMWGHRAPA